MNFNGKAAPQKETKPAELAKGSWLDFPARILELDPLIGPMVRELVYIRERQKQYLLDLSRKLEQLPRGGDPLRRLDMEAHKRLQEKLATGQEIKLKDFERWKMDEMVTEPTSVELWILTDGSVSMTFNLPKNGGPRINAALQITAALREAGKLAEFDVLAGLWGNKDINMLASPGDSDEEVGEKFERNRKGLAAGTKLSPAFNEAIKYSSEQDTNEQGRPKRFAGMTHFLIISDGGLDGGDMKPLIKTLTTLFREGPAVSVDIAVLGSDSHTDMHRLVEAVKKINPAAAIGIVNSDDADKIPELLLDKVKERFDESTNEVQGVPDAVKRQKFRTVADLLGMR